MRSCVFWALFVAPMMLACSVAGAQVALNGAAVSDSVPAALSEARLKLIDACRADMKHRVGVWQKHGDLVCGCMFDGPNAWGNDADPARGEAREKLLTGVIENGGMNGDLVSLARNAGLLGDESRKIEHLGKVYPAVLFQNKAVVACFDNQCRNTEGCKTIMNDVSGSTPR